MMNSVKRMVLTAAAVAVMMSFATPAMAVPKVVDGGPGVVDPVVDPPVKDPKFPICEVAPLGCGNNPDPVADPGENPVADPPDNDEPVADPPDKGDPVAEPGKDDPANEEPDTGGGSGGSYSGSSGSAIGAASETIDRGGTFVSYVVPTALTNTMGDVGNSVKKNLPASVAKSLPDTGGGWSLLVLVAAGLITGGLLIRSIARRTAGVGRTAQ